MAVLNNGLANDVLESTRWHTTFRGSNFSPKKPGKGGVVRQFQTILEKNKNFNINKSE